MAIPRVPVGKNDVVQLCTVGDADTVRRAVDFMSLGVTGASPGMGLIGMKMNVGTRYLGTLSAAMAVMAFVALPSAAQYGGGTPPQPTEEATFPVAGQDQVVQVTTCSTIVVTGTGWSGAEVELDRQYSRADCPGVGTPGDVQVTLGDVTGGVGDGEASEGTAGGGTSTGGTSTGGTSTAGTGSTSRAAVTTTRSGDTLTTAIPVSEDGTFTAAVLVPADADLDDYAITVRGTGDGGEPRSETYRYDLVPAASFTPAAETRDSSAFVALTVALGLLILALGVNSPALVRRLARRGR